MQVKFKRCNRCNITKEVSEFYRRGKNGYITPYCKICLSKINKISREKKNRKNPDYKPKLKPENDGKYQCPKCKSFKGADEFYTRTTKSGSIVLSSYCVECNRAYCLDRARKINEADPNYKPRVPLTTNGERPCARCKNIYPVEEFLSRKSKGKKSCTRISSSYCRHCRSEKSKEDAKRPEYAIKRKRRETIKTLQNQYGLSIEEYDAMVKRQNGRCAICGNHPSHHRRLAVDHNHVTGDIRGLLCTKCNLFLGNMNDDVHLLARAIEYLKGDICYS